MPDIDWRIYVVGVDGSSFVDDRNDRGVGVDGSSFIVNPNDKT